MWYITDYEQFNNSLKYFLDQFKIPKLQIKEMLLAVSNSVRWFALLI